MAGFFNSGTPILGNQTGSTNLDWITHGAQNLLGKADPTKVGTSNAQVNAPTGNVIPVSLPADRTTQPVVQQTQGPAKTTIAATPAMQAAQINRTADAGAYSNGGQQSQAQLMSQLAAQANGTAPSIAQTQLQQGNQANLAATMAALASSRGQPNALNQRSALNANAQANANTNNQAALLRLQEQQGAQQQLAGVSNNAINSGLTARGQDIGVNTNQANLTQGANTTNYQGNLQTNLGQGQLDSAAHLADYNGRLQTALKNGDLAQGYNQQQLGRDQLSVNAQEANQQAGTTANAQSIQAQSKNADILNQNKDRQMKSIGGTLSGISGLAGSLASHSGALGSLAGGSGGAAGADSAGEGAAWAGGDAGAEAAGETAAESVASKGGFVPETPKDGGYVAGKASFAGDNVRNDKVPTWLSPGEAVVPRSVMHAPDPVEAFKAFLGTIHTKPIGKSIAGHDDALHAVIQTAARARKAR